jgi:hypothetical protein
MNSKQKAHTVYKDSTGQRVPSVTTILHILDKPALLKWAYECGVQGIDYTKVRDKAADIGTLAHALILDKIVGATEPSFDKGEYAPDDLAHAKLLLKAYEKWATGKEILPILVETPFISDEYQYGGTLDLYARIDGVLTLLDIKTSGGVYAEHFHQVAAYRNLLNEQHQLAEEVKILWIDKQELVAKDYLATNLEKHWEIFKACRTIYELQKQVRRKND